MKLKKALALLLGSAMLLALAACGGGTSSTAPTPETTPDTSEAAPGEGGEETPGSSGETIEVVFWHSFSGATGEAFESIIADYNSGRGADKGIHVDLVFQGYEGTDKVILAYQTKDYANAPDINVGLTSTIPSVMDMDWSVPASRFLGSADSGISADTFYPALQRSVTYEGEIQAIPFANSIPVLYYNIEALKDAGYDRAPETFEELAEYIEALTVVGDNGEVERYGLNMQVKRYQFVEFIVSQGVDTYFGDNEDGRAAPMTRVVAGENGSIQAFLEKLQLLLETGGYKYIEDSINEEFAQGLSAMVIQSSSRMGTLDSLMPGEYMTAYIPKVNATDDGGAGVGGSCLNLFDRGDEARLAAAWDVIEHCVSPESQYVFSTASGYLPVNVACEDTDEMKAYYAENPQYQVALEQMKDASPTSQEPLDLTYNEINGIITDVMLDFCQGNLTIEQATEQIVNQCNDSLDEYHWANG